MIFSIENSIYIPVRQSENISFIKSNLFKNQEMCRKIRINKNQKFGSLKKLELPIGHVSKIDTFRLVGRLNRKIFWYNL